MNLNRFQMLSALAIIVLSLSIHASAEWTEQVLYSFQGGTSDGAAPAGGVVFDKAGNLYGALTSPEGLTVPPWAMSVVWCTSYLRPPKRAILGPRRFSTSFKGNLRMTASPRLVA